MTDMDIDRLLYIERFLPIMSNEEQDALFAHAPTLTHLQNWQHRLDLRTARIDDIFHRAYNKQKK